MASRGYKLSASIAHKYAPLVNRSLPLHEQTPKSHFPFHHSHGSTNIDLWVDGSIYPHHPSSQKRSNFRTVSELLEFVGDGRNGLLGYVKSLCSADSTLQFKLNEVLRENHELREQLHRSMIAAEDRFLQIKAEELHERQNIEQHNRIALEENFALKIQIHNLNANLQGSKEFYNSQLTLLQAENVKRDEAQLQLEIDFWIDYESLKDKNLESTKSISSELRRTKATLKRRDLRIQKMVKTPYGYRYIPRPRRDLHALAPKGGHSKRTLRLEKSIISPNTINEVQRMNRECGSRQRLHGSKEIQSKTGEVLASMLSIQEVSAICSQQKMASVGIEITNQFMEKIGENVQAHHIVETCDRNGITHKGCAAIYKQYKSAVKLARRGLRVKLPNPHQISLLRQMLNLKLDEYVREYYSIEDTLEIQPPSKSKKKEPIKVILNDTNTLFLDLEQVQQTMVRMYDITPEEVDGRPLIFVLKLDEAQIVHGVKMERVSLTLMNRALDDRILSSSDRYFSVQSEREIWPVASFQIPQENNEILSWILSKTKIPELLQAQEDGQLLEVPGVGLFSVEWHLSADLKTIKCMYGLKLGANSLQSCIYCNHKRVKPIVSTIAQATIDAKNRKFTWEGGLFSSEVEAKPLTGFEADGRWKPILSIPLDRVHICTMHAMNRIIEKLVHMHFMHVWTIRDSQLQKQATREMEKIVSLTGAHGGNVVIFKDTDLSRKSNNVPNKPSFSGAHAIKFFTPKPDDTSENPHPLYVDLVNAEIFFNNNGQDKRDRIKVWAALHTLRPYFSGLRLEQDQTARDFRVKMDEWAQRYIKCFGESNVTHYMHIIARHAIYFIERYGSLGVWSCQGMENSHHMAKTCYQRHTQYGGGKNKKSALVQTYEHWYRIIAHRFRNKELALNDLVANTNILETIARRQETSVQSSAAAHSALWREKRIRKGSKWIPNEDDVLLDVHHTSDQ